MGITPVCRSDEATYSEKSSFLAKGTDVLENGNYQEEPCEPQLRSLKKINAMHIKLFFLVALCIQNASYTMLRRYSVGVLKETYSASSVLLVGEIMKLIWAAVVTVNDSSETSAQGTGVSKLTWLVRNSLAMLVPAGVYLAQNVLSYISLSRIDANTFTVCAQLKILTTAICSVLVLGKHLSPIKWRSLILLLFGVILVANSSAPTSHHGSSSEKQDKDVSNLQYFIGLAAVLIEVSLSGFVAVYFERVLKSKTEILR